jgi:serine/threonine-protein kinase
VNEFDEEFGVSKEASKPPAGARMIGRYRVVKQIGRGGMGEVLKAVDTATDRTVAIKLIDAEAAREPDALRRFEREAKSAMALDHPRIAQIYAQEKDASGRPFLVMEYVDGKPLDRFLKENPEAPFSQLVDIVLQVAQGLDAAHRRSIIHRDIKPSNILITPAGGVKIIDFGLAKSLWDESSITATDMVVGTPRYISPEQGMGRGVDHRSDIYSLGATFYELVTRQSPFDGDTPLAIMMKHINSPLTPPYMINPHVPADINRIICKMMAKDPGERYQNYDELISELEQAKLHRLAKEGRLPDSELFALGEAPTVHVGTQGTPRSYLTEGLVHVRLEDLPDPPPPSRMKIIALSVVGVLLIAAALYALLRPAQDEAGIRQPSPLARGVLALLGRLEPPREPSAEQLAAEDAERVATTRARIELMINKILDYQRTANRPGRLPTIKDLRRLGLATEEETRDGWGNDLIIISGGDGVVKSVGRDGIEGTGDDFIFTASGTPQQVPRALTPEEIEVRR